MTRGKLFLAILLNLFVFPGAGQMFLKQKIKGLVIMITSATLLCAMIFHTSYLISSLVADIPFTTDLWILAQGLTKQLLMTHGFLLKSYLFAIVLVYLYAILDAIWIGLTTVSKKTDESR